MTGLDNILNELAHSLNIGNDALKSFLSVFGENYQQVYQNLSREYTMYIISNRFGLIAVCFWLATGVITTGYGFLTETCNEAEERKKKKNMTILITIFSICFLAVLAYIISPVFYPNINLIMNLLDK